MKTAKQLFLLSMLSALPVTATAADATGDRAAVDTSKWKCSLCKFPAGASGNVDVGAGYVSDRSSKFGDYTGLDEQGGFLIGGGSARFRGEGANYWEADAADLGLESRALSAEGGKQGKYKLNLRYEEIPHFGLEGAQTPFIGSGGASLTLPAGFPAGTTALMPLAGTLQPVDIGSKRKRLGVGASLIPRTDWQYSIDVRHETRDGTKRTAGAFFVNAAQFVEPIDYVTDQIDAAAAYTGARLQFKLAYYGSRFSNDTGALTWQNPFTVLAFPGALAGQLALSPDNQFHQISAAVGYQLNDRMRATADIAFGRMTQDDGFLAPTLNTTLAVPALPRNSLDGRVDTLNANVKLTSAVTDQLRLTASYSRDDRDNQTPQAVYSWVSTDMFLAVPRTNLPYSFTRDKVKVSGDYRVSKNLRASAGIDHDEMQRTFQEVDRTRENTVWGKVTSHAAENVDVSLKLAHGERRNTNYRAPPEITPAENPLLRKYNMANRTRDTAGIRADIAATEKVNVGVGIEGSQDNYSDSAIGLTDGREYSLNGDVSVLLTEKTSLHFFANHQVIESTQTGSQTFSTPDWSAENKDTINLVGAGVKHAVIKDKLDVGADYTLMRSRSAISVNTGAAAAGFPDMSTALDSVKVYAVYRLKQNVSLNAGYWYERYDSDNWMLDGVAPGTVTNLLALGEQAPRYHVHVIRLSVRYKF